MRDLQRKKTNVVLRWTQAVLLAGLSLGITVAARAQNWVETQVSGAQSDLGTFGKGTWMCVLSGVKGDFEDNNIGGQELVWVSLLESPIHAAGDWVVHAGTGSRTARMTCTKWTNFSRPANSVNWTSDEIMLERDNQTDDFTVSTNLWMGDAASTIAWMGGEFNGGGESITITQNASGNSPNKLTIHSEAGDNIRPTDMIGKARSFFVGNPNSHLPLKLIGYDPNGNKVRGTVSSAGTFDFAVSTQSGFSTFFLADTTGAAGGICYFTRLSGDFNGAEESAIITEVSNTWRLRVTAGSGSSAYATARCMAYDQR